MRTSLALLTCLVALPAAAGPLDPVYPRIGGALVGFSFPVTDAYDVAAAPAWIETATGRIDSHDPGGSLKNELDLLEVFGLDEEPTVIPSLTGQATLGFGSQSITANLNTLGTPKELAIRFHDYAYISGGTTVYFDYGVYGVPAASSTPEPTTIGLLVLATLAMLCRRRR